MFWHGSDTILVISWPESLHIIHYTLIKCKENVKYCPDMEKQQHTALKTVRWVFSGQQEWISYITETSTIYLNIYWGSSMQEERSRSQRWHRYPRNESLLLVVISLSCPVTSSHHNHTVATLTRDRDALRKIREQNRTEELPGREGRHFIYRWGKRKKWKTDCSKNSRSHLNRWSQHHLHHYSTIQFRTADIRLTHVHSHTKSVRDLCF